MSDSLEVMARDVRPLAVERQQPSPADILQAAVAGGITKENVEVVERICAMQERMNAKSAEREYYVALAALRAKVKNVIALKEVDTGKGKYLYAPLLDVWNQVEKHVNDHGFILQWSQRHGGNTITAILTLAHTGGHSTQSEFTIRIGSHAHGTPEGAQAPVLDAQAETRAKRRCLLDALNIMVDATGAAEDVGDGSLADPADIAALQQRLFALGQKPEELAASEKRFLWTAGVSEWKDIPKAVLPVLQRLMSEKERAAARKGAA